MATKSSSAAAKTTNTATANAVSDTSRYDLIARSKFDYLSNYKFGDFFGVLATGIQQPQFAECDPQPAEIIAENQALVQLTTNAKDDGGRTNSDLLTTGVSNAKVTANKVADWIELTYPGDSEIAAFVGMAFYKRPASVTPAPTEAVKKLQALRNDPVSCKLTWSALSGLSGKVDYLIYCSIDDGATYLLVGATRNSRGFVAQVPPNVVHSFYVQAKTSGGLGPISDYVTYVRQ